tara:strand:+ start:1585 stop:1866 length:282 start_codon:yes stop_codon:yes gene_type:complete
MARVKKLTPSLLKKMVLRERSRMLETLELGEENVAKAAGKTEEVDADEMAGSIEQDVDWMKALKIKESRLRRDLRKINEVKKKLRARVLKRMK